MRVRWLAAAMVLGGMLGMEAPAAAGGSWFELDRSSYAPGDRAIVRASFSSGQLEGTLADGPYYLYLVPQGSSLPRDGSPVHDEVTQVGPLYIWEATGNLCCWKASAEFIVPDVPAGEYFLDYCNSPCTVDGMGDLIGGTLVVGNTQEEARLIAHIERLEVKVEALARTKRDLRKAEAKLAEARTRYDQLVGRLRAARLDDVPAREVARPADRRVPASAVAAGLAVLAVGVWFRRRLGRGEIPDFVPDELLRDAQVPSRRP
jgi:hypothetical protein